MEEGGRALELRWRSRPSCSQLENLSLEDHDRNQTSPLKFCLVEEGWLDGHSTPSSHGLATARPAAPDGEPEASGRPTAALSQSQTVARPSWDLNAVLTSISCPGGP
jgi:hypothetical protein